MTNDILMLYVYLLYCVFLQHTLETALLSASQEIEMGSDNPAAMQSVIQQRDLLQSGLLSTCRELSRITAVSNTVHTRTCWTLKFSFFRSASKIIYRLYFFFFYIVIHKVYLFQTRSWSSHGGSMTSWKEMCLWLRTTSWSSLKHWEALR